MSIAFVIFYLIILIFSVMVHEVAHGYTAKKLGDDTAEEAGRLTFNPISHIDPFGSILLPLILTFTGSPILLAWAKPVPYNPLRLYKDFRYGPLKVALAGPISNFGLLIIFGLLARFLIGYVNPLVIVLFSTIALLNTALAVFNLLPIPPLDGSKIWPLLLPRRYGMYMEQMGIMGILLVFLFIYLFSGVIFFVVSRIFAFVIGSAAFGQICPALGICF